MNISLGVLVGAMAIFLFILYFVVESAAQKGIDSSDTHKKLDQIMEKLEEEEKNNKE